MPVWLMELLGVEKLYIDRGSGKNDRCPELQKMLDHVRRGDTVIVKTISLLARNTRGHLEFVERLTEKRVELVSQKETIDAPTPTGSLFLPASGR